MFSRSPSHTSTPAKAYHVYLISALSVECELVCRDSSSTCDLSSFDYRDVTQPLTEAALSASASTITTPLGSANAAAEAGLPTGLRGRFARLRGYFPFGRSAGGLEEGVVTGNETIEGREIEHRIEEEPDERTSLLGNSR